MRSWDSELRASKEVPFSWEPGTWYTMKVSVRSEGGKGVVRAKAWPRGQPEPEAWTLVAEDPLPIERGSPGLYGYSPAPVYLRQRRGDEKSAMSRRRVAFALLLAVVAGATTAGILAAQAEQASRQPSLVESTDYSLFGNTRSRNMVSPAKGLPERWNVETGENVLWVAELGSQSYGGPVLYKDRIFAGTNNEGPRNPKLTGDRGVLMVFDADSGAFLWQSAHAKLASGRVNDWPLQGICDGPHVEGDRLWYVSNRAELIAADVAGFRDGENDGPFTGETETGETDEDMVWKLDMIERARRLPPQPGGRQPAGGGRPRLHHHRPGRRRGAHQRAGAAGAELHRRQPAHRRAGVGGQPRRARTSSTAPGRTPPTASSRAGRR